MESGEAEYTAHSCGMEPKNKSDVYNNSLYLHIQTVSVVREWDWFEFGVFIGMWLKGPGVSHRGQRASRGWAPFPRSHEHTGKSCGHWRTCRCQRCCKSPSWSIP